MWSFSKKRFLITLGLSIVVWYLSVIFQGLSSYNAPFNLLLSETCKITGFPIARCIYPDPYTVPFWVVILINIIFWFWIIHLITGFFTSAKPESTGTK